MEFVWLVRDAAGRKKGQIEDLDHMDPTVQAWQARGWIEAKDPPPPPTAPEPAFDPAKDLGEIERAIEREDSGHVTEDCEVKAPAFDRMMRGRKSRP